MPRKAAVKRNPTPSSVKVNIKGKTYTVSKSGSSANYSKYQRGGMGDAVIISVYVRK